MKVIAGNREIVYSSACGCSGADGYLNIDGNSGVAKILAFQKFANSRGFRDSNGKPLVEDGKWGRNTNQAAAVFGKEFDSLNTTSTSTVSEIAKVEPKKSTLDTITGLFTKDETNPPVSATKTKTAEEEKAEKKKKMIKIALIAGGAIALTTIVILIARRKK